MFSSPVQLVLLPAYNTRLLMRRRPVVSLCCGLCLLALIALAIYYYRSNLAFWKAKQAFARDLLPEAMAAIETYLDHRHNDAEGHLLAVRIARLLGNPLAAERHLNEYQRLDGLNDRSQLEWLLLRAMTGELLEVEGGLHYLLEKKEPHYILILEALVYGYLQEYRIEKAANYLQKWLKEEPDNVRALSWRGLALETLSFLDDARQDYLRVLELSPEHLVARLRLANVLLREKDIPQAAEHLQFLQQRQPDLPEVLLFLAQCRAMQGQTQEAEKLLDRLLDSQPGNARALSQRGKLESEFAEQEKWFRKALQVDPSFHEARFGLFTCLMQQPQRIKEALSEKKKYEDALDQRKTFQNLLIALERTPRNPDLLTEAGSFLLIQDPAAGLQFLSKALAISPDHPKAHEILAGFFEKSNHPEKAAYHRNWVTRSPK